MLRNIDKTSPSPVQQKMVDDAIKTILDEFKKKYPELFDMVSEKLVIDSIVSAALATGEYSVKVGDQEETLIPPE